MHIIKINNKSNKQYIIGIHRTWTQVLSHNQVLSTIWASTFPGHNN